jgi:peptide deformylase
VQDNALEAPMILRILRYPDPRLREKSKTVDRIGSNLRALVEVMTSTMRNANGAGLSAVQVGHPLRVFIIEGHVASEFREDGPPVVFINPDIISCSNEFQTLDEGCLSFPGINVSIQRAKHVTVSATDIDGDKFEITASDFYARAIQHEIDHLDGKLMIDRIGPVKRDIIKQAEERAP